MKWKYKTSLEDENVFDEIENEYQRKISSNLRKLIKEANDATPEKYKVKIGKDEKILGGILSFNKNDKDTDTVFTALEAVNDKKLMPFAIDPFGNYFCVKRFDVVVFWNHETGKITSAKKDLQSFISSLY